jgi:CRISPR-associated exonuclease Cas4
MTSEDDELIPISALQHLSYCRRQAALIHVERVWREDRNTAIGKVVHEHFDAGGGAHRGGVAIAHRMYVVSRQLGVAGLTDMVELHRDDTAPRGVRPLPVEAKKGRTKHLRADEIQLCAQAIALEEMFEVEIPQAALYYATSHRRRTIELDAALRDETAALACEMARLLDSHVLPLAEYAKPKCSKCSLEPVCQPRTPRSATRWLGRLVEG